VPSAELKAAIEAAQAAARVIRSLYQRNLEVITKADKSPVTEGDVRAEQAIREVLASRFPGYGFYGEETGQHSMGAESVWLVDPIDGTKSFIRGVPLYATLVGCRRDGRGVLGVIAIPALDETVYAARGGGAWHVCGAAAPVATRVSNRGSLPEALLCSSDFTSFARWSGGADAGAAARQRLEAACGVVRTWGDGYGYLLVATGRADVMVDPLLNAWDAAAVETVVTEAGGRFTDWAGRDRIDCGDGVATNGVLHDAMLACLRPGKPLG